MTDRQIQLHSVPGLWPLSWPVGLTMLRLALLPLFLWLLLRDAHSPTHPHRWWAIGVFAVMAITDKLDGYLARRLHQVSKVGTILDPLADKILIACTLMLFTFPWIAPPGYRIRLLVVAAVYGKDLIIAAGTLTLLFRFGMVTVTPRLLGKISTLLQLALVIATLIALDVQRWSPAVAHGLTRYLAWGVTIVAVLSCVDYVFYGIRQMRVMSQQPRLAKPQVSG
jgi:CDP-diacylglycerol--glycerol-3-phosphate 3-phosphatidyltransferase